MYVLSFSKEAFHRRVCVFGHKQGGTVASQNCYDTWAERAVREHLLGIRQMELQEEGHPGLSCGHHWRGIAKCVQRRQGAG